MLHYRGLFPQLRREVALQSFAGRHSRHVLRLHAYFWDHDRVFLVLEYAEGGDLLSFAEAFSGSGGQGLPEGVVGSVVSQIASALAFLHRYGILHRDVKPENVLIKHGRVKLADFSWAVRLRGGAGHPPDPQMRSRTSCGTLDYLAPEQIAQKGCTEKADMWALGVLTYRLLCGRLPFEHASAAETRRLITHGTVYYPSWLSHHALSFIQALLCVVEVERLSAVEALGHPFLRNVFPSLSSERPGSDCLSSTLKEEKPTLTASLPTPSFSIPGRSTAAGEFYSTVNKMIHTASFNSLKSCSSKSSSMNLLNRISSFGGGAARSVRQAGEVEPSGVSSRWGEVSESTVSTSARKDAKLEKEKTLIAMGMKSPTNLTSVDVSSLSEASFTASSSAEVWSLSEETGKLSPRVPLISRNLNTTYTTTITSTSTTSMINLNRVLKPVPLDASSTSLSAVAMEEFSGQSTQQGLSLSLHANTQGSLSRPSVSWLSQDSINRSLEPQREKEGAIPLRLNKQTKSRAERKSLLYKNWEEGGGVRRGGDCAQRLCFDELVEDEDSQGETTLPLASHPPGGDSSPFPKYFISPRRSSTPRWKLPPRLVEETECEGASEGTMSSLSISPVKPFD
ncbi:unnamed protein product [Phytomonas sp. Hart1]|nr:unnamed protein product [Phytomonas sp. Hart1]|eukprot:CCW70755.1 unnamed protein product [Phytomonas sp. isolate Hart1]